MASSHRLLHQDQLDMDQLAETELTRLQRQYRIMEGDRRAFLDDITSKLSRQRRLLAHLAAQRASLLASLHPATCPTQLRRNRHAHHSVTALLARHAHLTATLRHHHAQLADLSTQIAKYDNRPPPPPTTPLPTLPPPLENRLENECARFGQTLAANRLLRAEIDHLIGERARFNTTANDRLQQLHTAKKQLIELIEQATIAYDQREELCSKLRALRLRQQGDAHAHESQMRETQRRLDHDAHLRTFLLVKGQRRVMRDLEAREERRREAERAARDAQAHSQRAIFDAIVAFCGESGVERMAGGFMKQEEENFALFNYVNELNAELEILGRGIGEVEARIEEAVARSEERARNETETLETLSGRLEEGRRAGDVDVGVLEGVAKELDEALEGIGGVFEELGCGEAPVLALLDDNAQIDVDNVFVYLGLLETKVSGMITSAFFREKTLMKRRK